MTDLKQNTAMCGCMEEVDVTRIVDIAQVDVLYTDSLLAFIRQRIPTGPHILRSVVMTVTYQEQVPRWMSVPPQDFVDWASKTHFSISDTYMSIELNGDGWIFALFPDSEEYHIMWTFTDLRPTLTTHRLMDGEFILACDKDRYVDWHCSRFGFDPDTGVDPYYDEDSYDEEDD